LAAVNAKQLPLLAATTKIKLDVAKAPWISGALNRALALYFRSFRDFYGESMQPRRLLGKPRATRHRAPRRLRLEALEDRRVLAAIVMSPDEQLVLELINRARANPTAEAARLGIGLNDGLAPGTISPAAKQPLAPHQALVNAATAHSQDMIDRDFFDHVNPSGQNPGQRMQAAGYSWNSYGENIAEAFGTQHVHDILFESASHRTNILGVNFREVGIGLRIGGFYVYGTENFGSRTGNPFITGVAFTDSVTEDNFYTLGEQLGGVTISAQRTTGGGGAPLVTTTGPSGGYSLQAAAGTYIVTASGGALATPIQHTITLGAQNVKVDFIVAAPPIDPDSFEPNDSAPEATVLATDAYGNSLACGLSVHKSFNDDFFRYVAPASGELTVSLDLSQDLGDIDLFVLDQNLSLVGSAETLDKIETVTINVVAGGVYYIQVQGYEGARHAHYDLIIDGPLIDPARVDAFEPNDTFETAHALASGGQTITGLTSHRFSDLDYFAWTADTSGPVLVSLTANDPAGQWNLSLLDAAQNEITATSTQAGTASVVLHATAGATYYLATQGTPCGAPFQPYQLAIEPVPPPVANDDRVLALVGGSSTFNPRANDTQAGPELSVNAVAIVQMPEHGVAEVDAQTGEITYTPSGGFRGLDRLWYTVTDGVGNVSEPAKVLLSVVDVNLRPWQNPLHRYDVDGDGVIAAADAVLIANTINAHGVGSLPVPTLANFPAPYYDVTGDNYLTAADAAETVNFINAGGSGIASEPAPAGEPGSPFAAWDAGEDWSLIAMARELAAQAQRKTSEEAPFERDVNRLFALFA
jgi:hypothetical protein